MLLSQQAVTQMRQTDKQKQYFKQPQMKQQPQIDFYHEILNEQTNSTTQNQKFKIINHIDINQKNILISSYAGLHFIELDTKNQNHRIKIIENPVYHAVFIPHTNYIAYCLEKYTERNVLYIYNWKEQKLMAKLKIQTQIQSIKTSRACIGLAGLADLYVLHFPSLKPIYNGPAGNTISVLFDLCFQGLTIAHNSYQRGELVIRNFTNIRKKNEMTERKKSIMSSRIKPQQKRNSQMSNALTQKINEQHEYQRVIYVEAHQDSLSQIKVSPNGSKVVTASNKGTVLRIFSTKNGQKLQQFRIGFQLIKIIDITFISDGNMLGCMTQKGNIYLFNVRMNQTQRQYQNLRLGHNIYIQQNPKSFFSFLSFLYSSLDDSYPFNYFKLMNPQYKDQDSSSVGNRKVGEKGTMKVGQNDKVDVQNDVKNGRVKKGNSSITELDQEHHENDEVRTEDKMSGVNSSVFNAQSLLSSQIVQNDNKQFTNSQTKPLQQQNKQSSNKSPSKNQPTQRGSLTPPNRTQHQSLRRSSHSKQKYKRIQSTQSNNPTYKSSNRRSNSNISDNMTKIQKDKFQRPFYHTKGKLFISQANYVWAVKGYHIFGLKYDAFHGGEMILDQTRKIQ